MWSGDMLRERERDRYGEDIVVTWVNTRRGEMMG